LCGAIYFTGWKEPQGCALRYRLFDQGEFYALADGVDAFGADVDGVA